MRPRLDALVYGLKKPQPSVAVDASYALQRCPGRPCALEPDDPPAWWESYAYLTRSIGLQHAIRAFLVVHVSSRNGHGWSKR
jgi:hypothetical protein